MLVRFFCLVIIFSNIILPCAVCYGNPEDAMTQGMNMGILTLMGFIGFILSIIAYCIVSIFYRTKKIKNI